jgi:PAS domain S-box-containing protein
MNPPKIGRPIISNEPFAVSGDGDVRPGTAARESQLAAIVDWSDDAIVSKDLRGIIQSWNTAASRIFGYTAQEAIGQSILLLVPPELHAEEAQIMAKLAAGQRIDHYETQRVRKDGHRIEVSLTISPVRDAFGTVVGASKIARDISERKKTEEALRVAEKLASVGRMAATMAHEINNPLEAVINLIYLALNQPSLPEASRKYLEAADQELIRVAHITKQTLGFYREPATPKVTSLREIFDGLLLLYGAKIRNRNLHVDISVPRGMEITVVRGELRQVLANFLQNSMEAVPQGGDILIRATMHHRWDGGGDTVQITIADNGKGIAEGDRGRIFEPFFTTKKDVGTGLGLWVCQGIVQRHGGSIRLRSSITEGSSGTVFSIFLPVSGTAPEPIASKSALEHAV